MCKYVINFMYTRIYKFNKYKRLLANKLLPSVTTCYLTKRIPSLEDTFVLNACVLNHKYRSFTPKIRGNLQKYKHICYIAAHHSVIETAMEHLTTMEIVKQIFLQTMCLLKS